MKTSDSSIFFHLEKMAGLFRSFRDLDRLLEQILGYLITVAEAERGFLFLCDERAGDLRLAASVRPDPETVTDALGISQSILRGSLSRTAPTYSSNALQDERFRRADSVVKYRIRSFVCTPMWFEDKILGTIYLDNRSPRGGFREEDANLLFAFASFLAPVIVNARRTGRLESNLLRLQEQMSGVSCPEALLGRSRKLREVLRLVDRVKETEASVLILGESGTGKELLARSLHLQGPRRLGPFVPVNCAAIPDTLIESELFGVARGAATDVRERAGKFEEADGGTVFLDEIGDLSRNAQAKVLRALQEREIQRVGSNARIPVDIRIVSATNRDLEALLARGAFREDLYFRINVIPIHLPPLRERREDIPLLMAHFNESSCRAVHRSPLKIPEATVRSYQAYRWPGNIRELRNVIERAVILVEEDTLPLLGEDRAAGELYRASLERALGRGASEDALRVDYTRRVLRKVGGNKRRACAILGIDFKTLQKRLQGAARRPRKPPLPPRSLSE